MVLRVGDVVVEPIRRVVVDGRKHLCRVRSEVLVDESIPVVVISVQKVLIEETIPIVVSLAHQKEIAAVHRIFHPATGHDSR